MTETAAPLPPQSIFQWETLRPITRLDLGTESPIPGHLCEIQLIGAAVVRVWKSDDARHYFCHGLTFGGVAAPGGPVSPFSGDPVETILAAHCRRISTAAAQLGDLLVWSAPPPRTTPHSAIVHTPSIDPAGRLAYETELWTKNGLAPMDVMGLAELILIYGESYILYRWRELPGEI